MASHQQPISAAREKGGVAARVRSREADSEAAVAEQPAKRSRTSKWDQQDCDAAPAVALPAQVGSVLDSAACVKAVFSKSSSYVAASCHTTILCLQALIYQTAW